MKGEMDGVKLDEWGYQVKTSSEACISAINSYYVQVLSYGRNRNVILDAPQADPECVLGNILAVHFLSSSDPSKASLFLDAAKSRLENSSAYEKAVYDAVNYLISPARDDDVAVELHYKQQPLAENSLRGLCSAEKFYELAGERGKE